ncbi:MAG: hypothetical protein ABWY39_02995 [Mycobacterium sp.]
MAEKFDVASRLAEGRPAVDNIGNYVWAAHLLGYQQPDLTLHPSQVRDWYAGEDGLDLRALDADCAALEAASAAIGNALRLQDDQLAALSGAWQGIGADASREFLMRHADASAAAATGVRTAARALTGLRDSLWQMVDGKVAAATAIDDRRLAERADWLAAAKTVTTGAGDRAVASELIDQEVKPFVDNDIRSDWLSAMRTTTASVAASYDAATAGLAAEPAAVFQVPGDLGPAWSPPSRSEDPVPDEPARGGGGVATYPAAVVSAPPAASSVPAPTAPAPAAPAGPPPAMPMPAPLPEPAPTAPAMAPAPSPVPALGDLGGGLPGSAGGPAGLGQQLVDALGGLLNPAGDTLPDPPGIDDREPDEPGELEVDEGDDPDDDEPDEETVNPDGPDEEIEPAGVGNSDGADTPPADACDDEPADAPLSAEPTPPPAEPAPTPAPIPPPAEPPAPPTPAVANETPCEIAADELPQVGQ